MWWPVPRSRVDGALRLAINRRAGRGPVPTRQHRLAILSRDRAKTYRGSTRGRVAEWFKAPVLKTGVPARVPWVRIPPLPPALSQLQFGRSERACLRGFGRCTGNMARLIGAARFQGIRRPHLPSETRIDTARTGLANSSRTPVRSPPQQSCGGGRLEETRLRFECDGSRQHSRTTEGTN